MIAIVIIVGLLIALVGFVIGVYNKLVNARNKVENQFSQVDIQLKRRADLIPNLVETVKGYAKHEEAVFNAITEARQNMINAKTPEETVQADAALSSALGRLLALAVSEDNPELKANENFLELQRELTDTETKIQAARQFYNTVVMGLNTQIEQFPSNIVARMFGITPEKLFEIDEAERVAPRVSFK